MDEYISTGRLNTKGTEISRLLGWRSFTKCKEWVQSVGITSETEWRKYLKQNKIPSDIPRTPQIVYQIEWKSWGDFFGTGRVFISPQNFLPFEKARMWSIKSGISSAREWRNYSNQGKLPKNIPARPELVYSEHWISWMDWFGKECLPGKRRPWISYEQAKKWALDSNINTEREWRKAIKEKGFPSLIPHKPDLVYRNEWNGWSNFLKNSDPGKRKPWLPYKKATQWARSSNINTSIEWRMAIKKNLIPENIPRSPEQVYKKEWQGWPKFLRK